MNLKEGLLNGGKKKKKKGLEHPEYSDNRIIIEFYFVKEIVIVVNLHLVNFFVEILMVVVL